MNALKRKGGLLAICFAVIILLAGLYAYSGLQNRATHQKAGGKETQKRGQSEKKQGQALNKKEETKSILATPFLICIDPGHQEKADISKEPIGPGSTEMKMKVTGGTEGIVTRKPEYKLNLEASVILGELLEKRGFQVVFTRTVHNVNISNKERADIANGKNANLFVRIHADGSTDQNVSGFAVLTPSQNDPYTKGIFQDSLRASEHIVDEVEKDSTIKVRGISYRDDMSGFNWSKVPTTLIEMGYMTNPVEDRNLSNTAYLTNLLTHIADGIAAYAHEKS